jgi:hypothetical protein
MHGLGDTLGSLRIARCGRMGDTTDPLPSGRRTWACASRRIASTNSCSIICSMQRPPTPRTHSPARARTGWARGSETPRVASLSAPDPSAVSLTTNCPAQFLPRLFVRLSIAGRWRPCHAMPCHAMPCLRIADRKANGSSVGRGDGRAVCLFVCVGLLCDCLNAAERFGATCFRMHAPPHGSGTRRRHRAQTLV